MLFIFSISLFFLQLTGSPPLSPHANQLMQIDIAGCNITGHQALSHLCPQSGNKLGPRWWTSEALFLFFNISQLSEYYFSTVTSPCEIYADTACLCQDTFLQMSFSPTPSGICLLTEYKQLLWQIYSECQHK